MDNLDSKGLREYLQRQGLDSGLARRLEDEGITGSQFLHVNAPLLRACQFKAGEIITILSFHPSNLNEQPQTHSEHNELPQSSLNMEESFESDEIFENYDEQLNPYFTESQLQDLSFYEKKANCAKLRNWRKLISQGFDSDATKPSFVKEFEKNRNKPRQMGAKGTIEDNTLSGASSAKYPRTDCTPFTRARHTEAEDQIAEETRPVSSGMDPSPAFTPSTRLNSLDEKPWAQRLSPKQRTLWEKCFTLKLHLEKFDIVSVLKNKVNNIENLSEGSDSDVEESDGCHPLQKLFSKLMVEGFVVGKERKLLIRTLIRYIYYEKVSSPRDVSSSMKEALAKSIVLQFPLFISDTCDENVPWGSLYDIKRNTGFIVNAARSVQKKHPSRTSKRTQKAKSKGTEKAANPVVCTSEFIEELALIVPSMENRAEIFSKMSETFNSREALRLECRSIHDIVEEFPHLRSFNGELLKAEFRKLYAKAEDGCLQLQRLQPKILKLPTIRPINLPLNDGTLKALVLLNQHLPIDKRLRSDKKVTHSWGKLEDIVVVVNTSVDIDELVQSKRDEVGGPVQPYLIFVRSQTSTSILRTFLALDGKPVQLNVSNTLRAIDFLFITYYVFNVLFPYGWRNTFHFIQGCFYNFQEMRKKGHRADAVTPTESELWSKLCRL